MLRALPIFSLVALIACSSADSSGTGAAGGATTTTSSTTTTMPSACGADAGTVAWKEGLSQAAADGKVRVTFVSADPAPPAKGTNAFVVDVADGAGAALDGATIAVTPFMPEHGHGSSVTPTVKAGSQPGRYEVGEVDLFMPGIWEITFSVTPAGGAADPVLFRLCVEG